MQFLIPLTKVDEERRLIHGRAMQEVVDRSNELLDYESSKPLIMEWSKSFEEATGGLSLGNVRVMHGKQVAGKVTQIDFNDAERAVDVIVKVVDDNEWQKVLQGCYTGFSVGGSYAKKWTEDVNGAKVTKYTARPAEISLVDRPCIPTAKFFDLQKADGSIIQVEFSTAENELEKVVLFGDLFKGALATVTPRPAPVAKAALFGDLYKWSATDHPREANGKFSAKTGERVGGAIGGVAVGAAAGLLAWKKGPQAITWAAGKLTRKLASAAMTRGRDKASLDFVEALGRQRGAKLAMDNFPKITTAAAVAGSAVGSYAGSKIGRAYDDRQRGKRAKSKAIDAAARILDLEETHGIEIPDHIAVKPYDAVAAWARKNETGVTRKTGKKTVPLSIAGGTGTLTYETTTETTVITKADLFGDLYKVADDVVGEARDRLGVMVVANRHQAPARSFGMRVALAEAQALGKYDGGELMKAFNSSQPRDENGRWKAIGYTAAGAAAGIAAGLAGAGMMRYGAGAGLKHAANRFASGVATVAQMTGKEIRSALGYRSNAAMRRGVVNGIKGAASAAWGKFQGLGLKAKVGVAAGAAALAFGERPFKAIGLDPSVEWKDHGIRVSAKSTQTGTGVFSYDINPFAVVQPTTPGTTQGSGSAQPARPYTGGSLLGQNGAPAAVKPGTVTGSVDPAKLKADEAKMDDFDKVNDELVNTTWKNMSPDSLKALTTKIEGLHTAGRISEKAKNQFIGRAKNAFTADGAKPFDVVPRTPENQLPSNQAPAAAAAPKASSIQTTATAIRNTPVFQQKMAWLQSEQAGKRYMTDPDKMESDLLGLGAKDSPEGFNWAERQALVNRLAWKGVKPVKDGGEEWTRLVTHLESRHEFQEYGKDAESAAQEEKTVREADKLRVKFAQHLSQAQKTQLFSYINDPLKRPDPFAKGVLFDSHFDMGGAYERLEKNSGFKQPRPSAGGALTKTDGRAGRDADGDGKLDEKGNQHHAVTGKDNFDSDGYSLSAKALAHKAGLAAGDEGGKDYSAAYHSTMRDEDPKYRANHTQVVEDNRGNKIYPVTIGRGAYYAGMALGGAAAYKFPSKGFGIAVSGTAGATVGAAKGFARGFVRGPGSWVPRLARGIVEGGIEGTATAVRWGRKGADVKNPWSRLGNAAVASELVGWPLYFAALPLGEFVGSLRDAAQTVRHVEKSCGPLLFGDLMKYGTAGRDGDGDGKLNEDGEGTSERTGSRVGYYAGHEATAHGFDHHFKHKDDHRMAAANALTDPAKRAAAVRAATPGMARSIGRIGVKFVAGGVVGGAAAAAGGVIGSQVDRVLGIERKPLAAQGKYEQALRFGGGMAGSLLGGTAGGLAGGGIASIATASAAAGVLGTLGEESGAWLGRKIDQTRKWRRWADHKVGNIAGMMASMYH